MMHWDLVVCEPSPAAVNETNRWNYVKTTETSVSDTTPDVIKTRSFDFSITQLFKSLQKILSNQKKNSLSLLSFDNKTFLVQFQFYSQLRNREAKI